MDNRFAMRQKVAKQVQELFPELTEESGIYIWERKNDKDENCVYIGKATNLLSRTVDHIGTKNKSPHLEKSIMAHGLLSEDNLFGWRVSVIEKCTVDELNERESYWIAQYRNRDVKLYNTESGGTVGKTIIGERKERRDIAWRQKERQKVFAELREWFNLSPKWCAIKRFTGDNGGETILFADAEKLKNEFYGGKQNE
jgi:hypothetical protein